MAILLDLLTPILLIIIIFYQARIYALMSKKGVLAADISTTKWMESLKKILGQQAA